MDRFNQVQRKALRRGGSWNDGSRDVVRSGPFVSGSNDGQPWKCHNVIYIAALLRD